MYPNAFNESKYLIYFIPAHRVLSYHLIYTMVVYGFVFLSDNQIEYPSQSKICNYKHNLLTKVILSKIISNDMTF